MLFTPAAPVPTVHHLPGHDRWHPEIPPVAELIAGGSVRMRCQGGELLCGPVGVVGAEPGDLLMVEVLGIGRTDGRPATGAHPGVLGLAPSHAMLRDPAGDPTGAVLGRVAPTTAGHAHVAAYRDRASCRALTSRSQILLPVHVAGARISVGDLHFLERGRCRTADGWIDLRLHLTKRGVERFRITEPVLMPLTTSSLDATVAGLTADVA
ncbi:acetamidase/formamidase family protein [Actinoallomurus sp. NPDC052274]|uniref:acetamidase/formamidase family protein n=1 Tax=Actinoallomurus sp. NPDC052274 TaxID=3155420 RepID=UPI003417593D